MLLKLTTSSVSPFSSSSFSCNTDPAFVDAKYSKLQHRVAFMESEMSKRPPNPNDIFNLTILSGCRVAGRREVGIILTEEYEKAFLPQIEKLIGKSRPSSEQCLASKTLREGNVSVFNFDFDSVDFCRFQHWAIS